MPKLSGVVQIEETYFRENQRGAIELVNLVPTAVKERKPRLEITHILSELGFFRPELACVVTGIYSNGYVAADHFHSPYMEGLVLLVKQGKENG